MSGPSSKRVFAFRHVPFEDLGLIRAPLEERGISIEYADLYRPGAPLPDITQAAGLIFMGGPMSANDDLPYLRQELQLIAEAVERRQPVLGVCLGAQLIARALGAQVYPNPVKEIGWFEIDLTAAAARRPLIRRRGPARDRACNGTAKHPTCRRARSGWLIPRRAATRHSASAPACTAFSSTWK